MRGGLIAVAMAFGLASTALAQPRIHTHWSKIEDTLSFVGWRAQLQHMADSYGKAPINHMCVVIATYTQVSDHDRTIWGYLYWRENNELYTLSQSKEAMSDLSFGKRPSI